jgi:hypothetical protein
VLRTEMAWLASERDILVAGYSLCYMNTVRLNFISPRK